MKKSLTVSPTTILCFLMSSIPLAWYPFREHGLYLYEFKWAYACIVLCIGCIAMLFSRTGIVVPKTALGWSVSAFCISLLASAFYAFIPAVSIPQIIIPVVFYLAYTTGVFIKRSGREAVLLWSVIGVSFGMLIYYFLQHFGIDIGHFADHTKRAAAVTCVNKNDFAALTLMGIVCALILARSRHTGIVSVLIGYMFLALCGLVYLQSLAVFMSLMIVLAVGIFLLSIFQDATLLRIRSAMIVCGVLFLCLLWVAVVAFRMHDRLASVFTLTDVSLMQRRIMWQTALMVIKENPLLGMGIGMYEVLHPKYQALFLPATNVLQGLSVNPHNDILQIVVEQGVVGLLLFGVMSAFCFMRIERILSNKEDEQAHSYTLFVFLICVAVLTLGMFHSVLHKPETGVFFFLFLGLLTNVTEQTRSFVLRGIMQKGSAVVVLLVGVCMSIRPVMGDVLFLQAGNAEKRENIQAAEVLYLDAIAWKGYDYRFYHNYGNLLMEHENTGKALSLYHDALELHPYADVLMNSIGAYYYLHNNYVQAAKYFKKSLEINPAFFGGYFNYGLLLYAEGKYKKAFILFRKAKELNPSHVLVNMYVGKTYAILKEYSNATKGKTHKKPRGVIL